MHPTKEESNIKMDQLVEQGSEDNQKIKLMVIVKKCVMKSQQNLHAVCEESVERRFGKQEG